MVKNKTANNVGLISFEGEFLHILAETNKVDLLEKALNDGIHGNITSTDRDGRTILHTAAKHGSLDCVKLLLNRGADPNASSGIGDCCSTPLHHAVINGKLDCVAALLEFGVNLDLKNSMGKTALDFANDSSTIEGLCCADLINKVIVLKNAEVEEKKSQALYDMVSAGDFSSTKHILETMKDPYSIINNYFQGYNTLLFRASENGFKDIAQLLIHYKADGRPNAKSGMTPLYVACYHGHYDVVVLLSKVFPIQLAMPLICDQSYPLHACVMKEHENILEYLLTLRKPAEYVSTENQFYLDINKPMGNGLTCLHMAVMFGNVNIIQMLLGCKPFKKESEEELFPGCLVIDKVCNTKTAFHFSLVAGSKNSLKCAELLIQNGADVYRKFDDEEMFQEGYVLCTPLQYVCNNEKIEFIKLLKKYNVEDINGVALKKSMKKKNERAEMELLIDGVFSNKDSKLVLAASEVDYKLNPTSISWMKRHLKLIKEKWILNSALVMNSHTDYIKNNESLQMKVITHINLSENLLKSIPIIIFQMPSLKKLNLSHNKLVNLPVPINEDKMDPFINSINDDENNKLSMNWNCPSLDELELQHNLLKTVPINVFKMPALQSLNCGDNKIASLPFEIWTAKSLATLNLDNNCLTDLPIFDESAKSRLESQNETNSRVKEKEHLDVRIKKSAFATSKEFLFKKRPAWIKESDDSDEEEISKKIGLKKLSLSNNKLTDVPIGLACLAPNLLKINLNNNKITEISNCVYLFPEHLQYLELAGNNIKTFNLTEPKILGCYAFKISQISKRASLLNESCQHRKHRRLNELYLLNLSNNYLDHINLFVSNTQSMTPNTPSNEKVFCKNLKVLNISSNKLKGLPNGIEKFKKLESLSANQNAISTLPSELGLCSEIYELKLDNNLLKNFPQHVIDNYEKKKMKPLIRHLKSLHDKALSFPNIKLMFVGNHGKGKTTLLTSLRKKGNGNYQHPEYKFHFLERIKDKGSVRAKSNLSTVGVDICDWKYGKIRERSINFSTWDFGGQSEYYTTHQCFLSQRAIYLAICRVTDELFGIPDLESWLLNIQARVPGATVLIVGTHADKVDRSVHENFRKAIQDKFILIKNGENTVYPQDVGLPCVVSVIEVSCTSGNNIQELRDLIYNTAINIKSQGKEGEYKILDQQIPVSYIAVEKAVSKIAFQMKDVLPILNAKEFRLKVYEQLSIQNTELKYGDEELNQAVQFLHEYGTLLHFDDANLNDLYFINPQWFCDLLAHIVTIKNVNPLINNGLLKISDLERRIFFDDSLFPAFMVPKYIELLNKFDVAIKIKDEHLLVPSSLPDKQEDCLIIAENQSLFLKNPMDLSTCLQQAVFRRQYLLTYIPSGLWARLLTRVIADDQIHEIVFSCCDFYGHNVTDTNGAQYEYEILRNAAHPEWTCWKTGIELSCFGIKLLRVSQLDPDVPFYGSHATSSRVLVKNPIIDLSKKVAIEITAPGITLNIDKYVLKQLQQSELQDDLMVSFCVKSVHYNSQSNACKLLVLIIQHIDTLLAEWYPQLDTYIDFKGINAVRRVSFCSKCIESVLQNSNNTAGDKEISFQDFIDVSNKYCVVAFELEQASMCLNENKDLICPTHGVVDIKTTFPDLCFLDVDPDYVLNDDMINRGKFIAKGGFGDVFVAEIKRGNLLLSSAMKISGGFVNENEDCPLGSSLSYDAYKVIRQEVSILLSVHHEHIVKFLGVSSKPFALFLELAPKGALNDCLSNFLKTGKRLTTHTVTESLKQISSALMFLHYRGIIYRDLKSDNVLIRKFPDPFNECSISQVHLLLTDYGISRSVSIGGNKGHQGTPGYIAPEISMYTGKEIYSEKVDCFSFGSFIYELLSLQRPFYDVPHELMIKEKINDGKRPKLTNIEKKYPALILSLLYYCWSHKPDDRPSASEIYSLTVLNEFQSLLDILELGKKFCLQCVVTSSQGMNSHNVTSSRCQVGSSIWFCGGLNNSPGGVVTIFTYNDYKYSHTLNLQLKEKILVACSVGNVMWLGTEAGSIKVYCAITLKLVAIGEFFSNECILCMEHFPVLNCVVVTFSKGTVLYFPDWFMVDINDSNINRSDKDSPSHPLEKIIKLLPSKKFFFDYPIHSMAMVSSYFCMKQSSTNEGVKLQTTSSSTEMLELWCGQEKGQITILNAKTMSPIEIIPVKKNGLDNALLNNLTITFLETPRSYDLLPETKKRNCHIWIVTSLGTQVEKWNVDTRQIEKVFYASQHVVSLSLNSNSKISAKPKITKNCDSLIQTLVVVDNSMYVGTSSGSFYICNAQTMIPHTLLRCYKELISFITPFRMKTGTNEENDKKLILTCGQSYLDRWIKTDSINDTLFKEMTVLIWDTKKL